MTKGWPLFQYQIQYCACIRNGLNGFRAKLLLFDTRTHPATNTNRLAHSHVRAKAWACNKQTHTSHAQSESKQQQRKKRKFNKSQWILHHWIPCNGGCEHATTRTRQKKNCRTTTSWRFRFNAFAGEHQKHAQCTLFGHPSHRTAKTFPTYCVDRSVWAGSCYVEVKRAVVDRAEL